MDEEPDHGGGGPTDTNARSPSQNVLSSTDFQLQVKLDRANAEIARLQIESDSEISACNARVVELEMKLGQDAQLKSRLEESLDENRRLQDALNARSRSEDDFSRKLDAVESEKRDLLELVRDKQAEEAELQDELRSKVEQLSSFKVSVRELESTLLAARETERTARLQAQSARSEASLAGSDRDFYAKELERTRQEWQTFRAATNQQTSSLQSDLDKVTHAQETTVASLESLRSQHQKLQKNHSDALDKIKLLTNQSIEAEAAFQKEIEAQKRMTDLMDKRDKHRAETMDQYEQEWNARRAELDARETSMNSILEQERQHAVELQKKLDDATNTLSRVNASETLVHGPSDGLGALEDSSFLDRTPATPLSRMHDGSIMGNGLSPAAAMASKLQRHGKSLTEIYAEKMALEEQLKGVKLENLRLSETLSQILGEIEDRAPLLHQQRVEHERIERECDDLTVQLTQTMEEKEEVEKRYHSCLLDLNASQRERDLVNLQVGDLSLQVRDLTKQLLCKELGKPNGSLPGVEDDLMKDLGDWRQPPQDDDQGDVLMENDLITFKNIADLQQKNLRLLFFTRKLAAKLQTLDEERAGGGEDGEDDDHAQQAIDEAHELILKLRGDLKSALHKSEALSRERDMLRRMLAQAKGDSMQQSNDLPNQEAVVSLESQQKLEELHAQFEAYRMEIGADSRKINEDLIKARADLSQTQVSLAKANAQIEYLNERHRTLDQGNSIHVKEMQTLTASNARLQEHVTQSEKLLHQANESLTELKSRSHVLRHQVETLTTEREVWKGVEGRLTAENASLARERDNIGDILRNVQVMQGEIERNSRDSYRRFENQICKYEVQVRDLKERVKAESDAARQAKLQRELVASEFQQKLDKLASEHLTARESLSAALTAKNHLESQVGDLQKQLAMKEERLSVYESHRGLKSKGGGPTINDSSFSQEQLLQIEVADLKIELAAAREESTRAKEHVEQFQAISQGAEAALASLTATHDEYKCAQEAELARKQSALTSLEEHLKKVTEDLSDVSTQNSELHRQVESQKVAFEKEKSDLLNRIVQVEELEKAVKSQEAQLKTEVNQQLTSAQNSHNRYQAEVRNHATSLNELRLVKVELDQARETILAAQSNAELANAKLESSQNSWIEQKAVLQQEIANVQHRCDDLVKQNNLLHEHLETVSAQAAKISDQAINAAAGDATSGAGGATQANVNENNTDSIEQLRGVIHYLRNNYEICQQQIELSKLESTRIQQQLQHTSQALDQTRLELGHEREKSREGYVSSSEHTKLLEQINTLNVIRESNVTLRDEAQRSERKAQQLEDRLKQTTDILEPLKQEVCELKLTVQQYQQEIAILNEDNERWKARNQQILEKYERIDPAEVQGLRDEINKLKEELMQTQEDLLQTQHFREKFKEIQTIARTQRQRHTKEITALNEELAKVRETIQVMETDSAASQSQKNAAVEEAASSAREDLMKLRQEKAEVEAELSEALLHQAKSLEVQAALDALKAEFEESRVAHANRESQFTQLLADNQRFSSANQDLTFQLTQLKTDASQSPNRTSNETIEAEVVRRLDERLASIPEKGSVVASTETDQLHEQKLAQALEKAEVDRKEAVQKAVEETTERLTAQFTQSQAEAVDKLKAELTARDNNVVNHEAVVAEQVAEKVSMIKAELEAAAANKEKEVLARHERKLEEAKASGSAPGGKENVQEEIRVAVEQAVKAREAELQRSHLVAIEAAIETAKLKVTAEMNSKANVVQMQLKRAHSQIAELKKGLPSAASSASTAATSTTLAATVPAFFPSSPTPVAESETVNSASSPATVPPIQSTSSSVDSPHATAEGILDYQVVTTPSVATNYPKPHGAPEVVVTPSVPTNPPRPHDASVKFGRGSARGVGHKGGFGGRAGAPNAGTGASLRRPMAGQLPAEGRMAATKPFNIGPLAVVIKGAAQKKGGLGNSLIGAAAKAATNASTEASAFIPPPVPGLPALPLGKRGREDEAARDATAGGASQSGDGMKRPKGPSVREPGEIVGGSSELASRLSQRF